MKAFPIAALCLALVLPAGAEDAYTRPDVREAVQRIEKDGDRFKSEFRKAMEGANLTAGERRVRQLAEDLEDEVDNLQQNYKNKRYREAGQNLETAMLMAAALDRFMLRNYFGPEARAAWNDLRSNLSTIAAAYNIQPLSASSAGVAVSAADRLQTDPPIRAAHTRLERQVRHELVMLPYYGVFDNLAFSVDNGVVTLIGQVTRPTLKSTAENVVKDVEGVERVVNSLEVLPVSSEDDRIRVATYQAIYGHTALNRYGLQAVPPIHIIVRNGNVTLEGVVANEADKNIARMQAGSVPGVFSVTNNLRVE